MTEAVAAEDVAFLAQLRDLVTERQAALPAVVGMGSAPERDPLRRAQEDVRAQWDFDGSVVIGRADTAEGQRYYIGTRSVVTPDDHVVVVAQDSALGRAVWKDTSVASPARTALKRHLQVSGWVLTRSQTEFDLRDAGPAAAMPAPPTGAPVAGALVTPPGGPVTSPADGAAPDEVPQGEPDTAAREGTAAGAAAAADPAPQDAAAQASLSEGPAVEGPPSPGGVPAVDAAAAVDVTALDRVRTTAAQALREALARVESGAGGAAGGLAPVAAWDTAIADAAAALELPDGGATLDDVSAELTRREEERKAAERAALDERIEIVQRWLDGGGPGADEARAFLDQLTRLRERP